MAELETKTIRISCICVNPRKREHTHDAVGRMAKSLKENGLWHPILVVPDEDSIRFTLVGGRLRMAGAERLGWSHIKATFLSRDVNQRYVEMGENVTREDLSEGDKRKWAAEMVSMMETTTPEEAKKKKGRKGGRPRKTPTPKPSVTLTDGLEEGVASTEIDVEEDKPTPAQALARLTGEPERTAQRTLQAEAAFQECPEAEAVIRGTPVWDNRDQSIKIAQTPLDRRVDAAWAAVRYSARPVTSWLNKVTNPDVLSWVRDEVDLRLKQLQASSELTNE